MIGLMSYRCIVTINVLWLFLTVPWVGLQCVIVVFPDHTQFLFFLGAAVLHRFYCINTLSIQACS